MKEVITLEGTDAMKVAKWSPSIVCRNVKTYRKQSLLNNLFMMFFQLAPEPEASCHAEGSLEKAKMNFMNTSICCSAPNISCTIVLFQGYTFCVVNLFCRAYSISFDSCF